MSETSQTSDLVFESPRYRLELSADGLRATLSSTDREPLAVLRPHVVLDTTTGLDETVAVEVRRVDASTFVVERSSTIWERVTTTIECADDSLELRTRISGRGALGDVRFLALRSLVAASRHGTGFFASGSGFRTLFTPGPDEPPRVVRPAGASATIGVVGDSEPGRRRWLFTPAPLAFALTTEAVEDLEAASVATWTTFSLAANVEQLGFPELTYEARDGGFALHVDYEGHTHVDGAFEVPTLLIVVGLEGAIAGLDWHRHDLVSREHVPAPVARARPGWWNEPMFCGWGAQCSIAERDGGAAADRATQASYDGFLHHLAGKGLFPGTVVIDDKWQEAYGTNEPDTAKWPDLAGWIADRHRRGQYVLLWWKAWDPEGVPADLCVRNPAGDPVALDPGNPETRALLISMVHRLLAADGVGADGFKIDFTARTPSGRGLTHHGPRWGMALLHELLEIVYTAAKTVKPDALVVTHTPNPSFADVSDMIRLNDISVGASVSSQMAYRAAVARAACPELLVDTDDWRMPDLAEWRAYLALKPRLGVPALYYADALDATGEQLSSDDYAALRDTWAAWRASR
jgi:hypothetical protein